MYEDGPLKVQVFYISMLGGSLVTTAWRVLKLQTKGQPPAMEGSCKYIK
jgi:hypothetical protein